MRDDAQGDFVWWGKRAVCAADAAPARPHQNQSVVCNSKAFGRAINSEVLEKVGKLESELQCVRSGMAEEKAVNCRARILRFGDECLHGERHTKDHFDQTLRDIAAYERYCEDHPEFENNVTELTSDRIKTIYRRCLDSNDFLQ